MFATGKLNIKEDREDSQMRSFPLCNLVHVYKDRTREHGFDTSTDCPILSKTLVAKRYPFDESKESNMESNWPNRFHLEFKERNFTLHARTILELDAWVRVFKLILEMNREGVSLLDENPYVYE